MFRDDESARAQYRAAVERKAARVDELEARVYELEAENRQLRAHLSASTEAPLPAPDEIYVDPRFESYVFALIKATDPALTDGILVGAPPTASRPVLAATRTRARAAGRALVTPDDVQRAVLELLPSQILMKDPNADPRGVVRAIIAVVEVP